MYPVDFTVIFGDCMVKQNNSLNIFHWHTKLDNCLRILCKLPLMKCVKLYRKCINII